jgi:hypothetical protein
MNESVSYAMEQFFGGYFHPDWDLEADDWPEIVDNLSSARSLANCIPWPETSTSSAMVGRKTNYTRRC